MATEKTDVVIIGVGAAGGILAAELGKAGMKVIGLERGPRLTTADFNPHDELRYFQLQDQAEILFGDAGRKLGYHPFSTPRAIISQPYNGRPACTYCGFCQAFGCHVGAKSSILVTKLPEADNTGNFKLLTGATCYRIN